MFAFSRDVMENEMKKYAPEISGISDTGFDEMSSSLLICPIFP